MTIGALSVPFWSMSDSPEVYVPAARFRVSPGASDGRSAS